MTIPEWYDTADGAVPACDLCAEYVARPHFIAACTSVGISNRKSTFAVARAAVNTFHARGHR